ncbi:MAG: PAS-domain containing protein [Proteobacteria bacterium]|nr:PAS-domain containing protein [Pseudomonadota bacterium]
MWEVDIGEAILALILAAVAAIWAVTFLSRGAATGTMAARLSGRGDAVFLFDGGDLLALSDAARATLGRSGPDLGWGEVSDAVRFRFPGFPDTPPASRDMPMSLRPTDPRDPARLDIEQVDGITRIVLSDDAAAARQGGDVHILRHAVNDAPYPAWRIDSEGRVIWFNRAYADLFAKLRDGSPAVDTQIFGATHAGKAPDTTVRASILPRAGDKAVWFDVTMRADGDDRMFHAVDVSAVVKAEIAQRNFIQTLAKTFAQLSFGLAIFDRNRQLALFNPALIDLTGLSAEFLSARPSLASFFDALRENRTMPEPKNYGTWREKVAELDAGARHGTYHETWTLANGSTYRVNGRPHPDGAVAFLFEDISAEVGLTRRFRAELELAQAVMDQIEDAMVVFSPTGRMKASNRAYRLLWKTDPDTGLAAETVVDAMRIWHDVGGPSPVWGELRDFVLGRDDRTPWSATVTRRDGTAILCLIDPIAGGATMIRFRTGLPEAQPSAELGDIAAG